MATSLSRFGRTSVSAWKANQPLLQRTILAVPGTWWIGVSLLLLGLITRFYHLGTRSLWLDEIFTADSIRFSTLGQVGDWTHAQPDQMPLLYALVWLLRGLGGAEWVIRLPSAVAGTLSVVAVYVLATTLFRPRTGLLAGLLMALVPFSVWYGQEARAYALLMLLTTLQMLFAFRAVRDGRLLDWSALVLFSVANLYTHYAALAVTAAVFSFIALTLFWHVKRRRDQGQVWRTTIRECIPAVSAFALIALSYIPWIPFLRGFLTSPYVGLSRVTQNNGSMLHDLTTLLATFDLSGAVLFLGAFGFGCAAWWLLRGPRRVESLLLLSCVVVPVVGFTLKLRGAAFGLTPRYYSFLFPVAVLLAAVGVEGLASIADRTLRRSNTAPQLIYWFAIPLLLSQIIPALTQSYRQPKDDYRDATSRIIAASPPQSVVLTLGDSDAFVTRSLGYYLWLNRSSIMVTNGPQVDDRVIARLRHKGAVWGALFTAAGPNYFLHGPPRGFQVIRFTGVALLRPPAGVATTTQTRDLLMWARSFQPQLQASIALLHVMSSHATLGKNLLTPLQDATVQSTSGRWWLTPGTSVSSAGNAVDLTPRSSMVNVVQQIDHVHPGQRLVIAFRYQNSGLKGQQQVFVVASDRHGKWLDIFPTGAGYVCASASGWREGIFALAVPPQTHSLAVWLRATGAGRAEFSAVQLRPAH